jgi:hypothetical protein
MWVPPTTTHLFQVRLKTTGDGLTAMLGVGRRVPLLQPLDATLRVNGKTANLTATLKTAFK